MGDKVISKSELVCRMHETKFTQRFKELHSEDSLYSMLKNKQTNKKGFCQVSNEGLAQGPHSGGRNYYKSHVYQYLKHVAQNIL